MSLSTLLISLKIVKGVGLVIITLVSSAKINILEFLFVFLVCH